MLRKSRKTHWIIKLGLPFISIIIATIIKIYYPAIGRETPFLVMFTPIVISGLFGGFLSGLLATFLAAISTNYFFIRQDEAVFSIGHFFQTGIFIIEGWIFSMLIEKRRTAEVNAKESEESMKAVIEGIRDYAILILDIKGYIQSLNNAAEKIFSYPREELIGKHFSILYTQKDKQNKLPEREVKRTLQTGRSDDENWLVRKDKTFFWAIGATNAIKNNQGEVIGLVKIARDMTERKDLEQQKDDFISIASHELRTPITSIKLYAEILEKHIQTTNDIQGKKYTSKINEQLKKLTELLNFLLDVSKIQSGKISLNYENANINNLITETVKVIQPTYKSHKIVIRGKVKGKIWIDKARISEVVINLISNAVKYSPQANEIIITLTQTDKKITISIKDFGIGIPKEEQKRIFDRFYRTKVIQQNQFPGIGLGLYIAYQIIKAHKGKMWVESENTKGSTFYFTLPGKSKAKKK